MNGRNREMTAYGGVYMHHSIPSNLERVAGRSELWQLNA